MNEELKDELIELQTIQIALDDKLHRFQKVMANLTVRIKIIEEKITQSKN